MERFFFFKLGQKLAEGWGTYRTKTQKTKLQYEAVYLNPQQIIFLETTVLCDESLHTYTTQRNIHSPDFIWDRNVTMSLLKPRKESTMTQTDKGIVLDFKMCTNLMDGKKCFTQLWHSKFTVKLVPPLLENVKILEWWNLWIRESGYVPMQIFGLINNCFEQDNDQLAWHCRQNKN